MKIAILGTAPLSLVKAPYEDKDWKIWVCSAGNQGGKIPRIDAWFELHALVDIMGPENAPWAIPYFGWLRTQPFPVYMQERSDLVPQATMFPRDALTKQFGRNWFSSSIAWMMAYALMFGGDRGKMGPGDEIGLFGVDMAADHEHYTNQRAGCIRWMEIAAEMGVKVHVPFESCLAAPPALYGYAEATNMGRRLIVMQHAMEAQHAQLAQQIGNLQAQKAYLEGALENNKYMRRTFVDGGDDAVLENMTSVVRFDAPEHRADPAIAGTGDFKMTNGGILTPKTWPDEEARPADVSQVLAGLPKLNGSGKPVGAPAPSMFTDEAPCDPKPTDPPG